MFSLNSRLKLVFLVALIFTISPLASAISSTISIEVIETKNRSITFHEVDLWFTPDNRSMGKKIRVGVVSV